MRPDELLLLLLLLETRVDVREEEVVVAAVVVADAAAVVEDVVVVVLVEELVGESEGCERKGSMTGSRSSSCACKVVGWGKICRMSLSPSGRVNRKFVIPYALTTRRKATCQSG
jgi:hypothetical protein